MIFKITEEEAEDLKESKIITEEEFQEAYFVCPEREEYLQNLLEGMKNEK
jgi:hypothetical protein